MANPVSSVLQEMNQKTVTLGWDVVVAYAAQAVNDLFAQQYVANVRASQNLPPISGALNLSSGVTVNLINVTLGPPLIAFAPGLNDQQAMVLMNFIAGEIVVMEQAGPVSFVSAYQAIVPGDNFALSMIVELQQVQGQVTSQNVVVVDLQNAQTFQANLLPGRAAASLLGTYFQAIFQKEAQGTLVYQLGTLTSNSDQLSPVTFDIRTQVYPGTSGPDGAVLLLVATTYNPGGGSLPGPSFPYLIPDGNTCALVVASRTLFGNIIQPYYENTLVGNPTLSLETFSGTSPASFLAFTGGGVTAGVVTANWTSGGGVIHSVWSGRQGRWQNGDPDQEQVYLPFNGLSLQPENDQLSMQWSNQYGQSFAATTCTTRTGCSGSSQSVTLTVSGGFKVGPTINGNQVSFDGGAPDVKVSFESSGWLSTWFGNGGIRDRAAGLISGAAQSPASQVVRVPLPQLDVFAVSHLLFPAENALQYQDAHLPGDLALFGAIQPTATAFTVTPLQAVIAAGQTQAFAVANGGDVTWTINPLVGSISPAGLYTAPPAVKGAVPVVITATEGTKVATAVVVVVPSQVSVSPAFTLLSPNAAPLQIEASVLGGLGAPTWSLSPSDGSVGTISPSGLYTPPATFPSGVHLATVTATAGGERASSLVCLLDAVMAFDLTPAFVVLGPNQTQPFSASETLQWTLLTPGVGSITDQGLYTAPPSVAGPATALVMAQSANDPGLVGLAVVLLTPSSS